jgi:hypothetical protein
LAAACAKWPSSQWDFSRLKKDLQVASGMNSGGHNWQVSWGYWQQEVKHEEETPLLADSGALSHPHLHPLPAAPQACSCLGGTAYSLIQLLERTSSA